MLGHFKVHHRLALMVVLAGVLSGCGISALHEVTQTVKHEHVPGSRLHVESANGSISVKQKHRSFLSAGMFIEYLFYDIFNFTL